MIFKLGLKLIQWSGLTPDRANELTSMTLDKLGALPIRDIIYVENNQLFLNGTPVDHEKARMLRESAISALNNQALNLIREHVDFAAITHGVHRAESPTQMIFGKAALWYGQQERKFLEELAQREPPPSED